MVRGEILINKENHIISILKSYIPFLIIITLLILARMISPTEGFESEIAGVFTCIFFLPFGFIGLYYLVNKLRDYMNMKIAFTIGFFHLLCYLIFVIWYVF